MSINNFTRNRKPDFATTINIMIKKSCKSLGNTLIDAKDKIASLCNTSIQTVTAGAYTRARAKLNYTAFIELCELVRDDFYEDGEYHTFKGYRLLAVDGSIVTLPNTESIKQEFSPMIVKNQIDGYSKEVILSRISVLIDVLNNIVIDASINDKSKGERALALEHIKHACKNDLIIFDRGYPSYELFASMYTNTNFLVRLRSNSFRQARNLFDINALYRDAVLEIKAPKNIHDTQSNNQLPASMKIRFVQVALDNGIVEVLATNVLDSHILQTDDFKALYAKRWGIETFYHIIKNRLSLENFTGGSALSIKQDFFITMFLSNYESLLTYDTNNELKEKTVNNQHTAKVNKSISFNTIKQKSFELFYSDMDIDELLENMQKLFCTNTVLIRPDRPNKKRLDKEKDKNTILANSSNYFKRKKKVIG
jgi:Transposase DDE domain